MQNKKCVSGEGTKTAFGRSRAEGESDTTYAQPQFTHIFPGSTFMLKILNIFFLAQKVFLL